MCALNRSPEAVEGMSGLDAGVLWSELNELASIRDLKRFQANLRWSGGTTEQPCLTKQE